MDDAELPNREGDAVMLDLFIFAVSVLALCVVLAEFL